MVNAKFLNQIRWEDTRGKCTSENSTEFLVKATNAHIFEFKVGSKDSICTGFLAIRLYTKLRSWFSRERNLCLWGQNAKLRSGSAALLS